MQSHIFKYRFIILLFLFISITKIEAQNFNQDLQKLQLSFKLISTFYVDSVDDKQLVEDAIVGMLDKLDPHSEYLSQDEVALLNEPLDGSFEGIGIQFNILKDTLMVVSPISGGPSEKVGVNAGDRILYIDDENVAGIGLKNSDVKSRLKGKKGTKVIIKVLRRGVKNLLSFTIERDKIPIHSVEASYMATSEIGYVKINQFSSTTHDEFTESLKVLQEKGMRNLILDLRGNPGGYLKAAIDIADEFLHHQKLIVYTEGLSNPRREFYSTSKGLFKEGKVIVLINEGSASASEIVSGAIQDWDRGIIVGRRSFGKGLVQRPLNLQDGSMIKLTIAKYYTPSGRCIQKPYDKGKKQYKQEIYTRYSKDNQSEKKDSSDLLANKYYTKTSNRVVYGGGGITPDIELSIDTTNYSDYYRDIVANGVLYRFALSFVDENRKELEENFKDFDSFKNGFTINKDIVSALLKEAEKEKFSSNEEDVEVSIPILKTQLKALIARNIWSPNEYFQIINPSSQEYVKSIEMLSGDKNYSKLLK